MKTPKANRFFAVLSSLFVLLLFTESCKQIQKEAQPLPDGIEDYISAFTSGVISRNGTIQVVFNSNVVSADEVGSEATNGLFELSPKVNGRLFWADAQTLNFQPENMLESDQSYVATVHLDEIFNQLPKQLKSFQFDFKTRDLAANFIVDQITSADPNRSDEIKIYGHLSTTDVFEDEGIHKMLTASQDGRELAIDWEERRVFSHGFSISGIKRKKESSSVVITLDENLLGKNEITRDTIEVPSLGEFKVINTQVIQGEEQFVQITFSDPLLKDQDIRGLVQIPGIEGQLKFLINGNQLKVYPDVRLTGEHELVIEPGIRNTNQGKLKYPIRRKLAFEAIKPAVRLIGSGNIIPGAEGLTFPFEAVGLTAVEVEIFKIYQNNVLQFLQTNNLNGTYDLERVGKIIHQEKVPLQNINPGAEASNWARYALDLSKMLKKDPEAIYQLRIGFRPEYTAFFCPGNEKEDANLSRVRNVSNDEEELESIMDGWYGINGYYQDYRWEDREDPCKPAYYNSDRFVRRNLISSNLAIIAKEGDDHDIFVAVNEILTTNPVGGAEVNFYNYQQQLIASATTNGAGMVNTQLKEKPFAIIVKKGTETGFLKLGDGNALSVSKFEVDGARKQKGLKGYIYGERGVWRPGDSLFINFILDDQENALPEFHPVKYTLKDARGQVKVKGVETNSVSGIYPLHMATQPDDPTGNWRLEVEVGGARFQKNLKIETVKPNRLKVKLDFGNDYLTGKDKKVKGDLQVNWLHGAPGKNLKVITEVQLNNKGLYFKPYNDFTFWDPTRAFNPPNQVVFEGKTDDTGKAAIAATLVENAFPPAMLSARFKTRAFEPGGNFSTDLFSMDYYPYDAYTGVRLPKNKWGQSRAVPGEENQFEFLTVNKDGKPLANRKVSVGIYEINWSWWWDQSQQRMAQYNSTNHFNALMRTNLHTNNEGKVKWPVSLERTGRYMVRVCDEVSQHCSGQTFYVGYPWYQDDEDNMAKKEASLLAFTAKKDKYQVGETVELEVPSGDIGKLLLSLEGGSKIMETRWQEVAAGTNTIKFTATKDMVPTVYAHVSLLQPHGQVENDHPVRMYGVIPIEIENKENILEPVLEMPSTLRPEQEVTVTVSEKAGKDMAYTIAMVDEGLLDLTRFATPDPYKSIYAKEALGIRTWDLYDEILGSYGGKLESILGVGGDGEVAPSDAKRNANRFKPVVRHLGPFYLKKGQKAKHTIKLPNYVGSVRTMVVAGKDGAYGKTDKTTPVKKPVMVLATLPRVLGPGESLKLPVNVFVMENKIKNVKVTVREVNGMVDINGSNSQTLNFPEPDEKMAYFDINVKRQIGSAKFEIKAEGNGESASQTIEIFVRNPNPPQRDLRTAALNPGEEISFPLDPVGVKGTNTGYLEVSRFALLDLAGKYDQIIRYPHGCLEQTTSTAFAQLYVDKAVKLDDRL
ncbi:MAG: alpha-2-macroglobulin, partial [Saprospiraceae bacterium]|nr:alpha-2-macroglobulin [Saprospiraceae bacterium]